MKFSVTFGAVGDGRDPRGLADLARIAEESGWDGVFLEDYLTYQGDVSLPTYDPWVCLAAMACATSRVRLGTTVTPLPRRRPWKVAAELTARPIQQRRIPIWIGGNLLLPAVRRRILRWDGSCAYKGPTTASLPILPEDVRALRAERGNDFAIKVSGGDPAAFAEAGATWWGRWIAPGPRTEAEQILRAGPPKL